jgi:actin-like ATPase involved in cell morphogenesis
MSFGFDCGTYNLICCQRDKDGNFVYKREVNAFLEFPLENRFVFNMMRNAGVPLIEREEIAYALGQKAVDMAYTMSALQLKRPMKAGCVNPSEIHAFQIMSIMIHSLLDEVKQDKETLYYSVPANAINKDTDADYHGKILEAIFKAFKDEKGHTVNAHPINEGLALIYAELANKAYTGIGISFGAGLINLCFAVYGAPVFQFSIVNSGDWIDEQAAKATNESPTYINKIKNTINLTKEPENLVQRAIQTQYRLMIEKTVTGIKEGLQEAEKKARTDNPIDIVIAGGTSKPNGFPSLFKKVLTEIKLPIQVGEVIYPSDPLYSVARGCLIAAENATK